MSSGRHARREPEQVVPGSQPALDDYVPRHAISTPGPNSVPEDAATERFARTPASTGPAPSADGAVVWTRSAPPAPETAKTSDIAKTTDIVKDSASVTGTGRNPVTESQPRGKRVRVVLSQRKGSTPRPVRTMVDVQELTPVGELISTSLIRSQRALALRVGGVAAIALGSFPAIFVIFPMLGRMELFGLRLPWVLLGVLVYPFLFGLGHLHSRSAERLEQVFVDHLES